MGLWSVSRTTLKAVKSQCADGLTTPGVSTMTNKYYGVLMLWRQAGQPLRVFISVTDFLCLRTWYLLTGRISLGFAVVVVVLSFFLSVFLSFSSSSVLFFCLFVFSSSFFLLFFVAVCLFLASNLRPSGCSRVGFPATPKKGQKQAGSWRIWYFHHICRPGNYADIDWYHGPVYVYYIHIRRCSTGTAIWCWLIVWSLNWGPVHSHSIIM